jgi:hypothetical protein
MQYMCLLACNGVEWDRLPPRKRERNYRAKQFKPAEYRSMRMACGLAWRKDVVEEGGRWMIAKEVVIVRNMRMRFLSFSFT